MINSKANLFEHEDLIENLGLTGFPSLLFLKEGVESIPSFYDGHIKNLENIKDWLDRQLKVCFGFETASPIH